MTDERRPWLKNYPPGVPADIGPLPHATIPALLAGSVARFGDRPAFENFGVQMSYAELDRLSRDFAAYLQSGLGLRKGDRVAVMMPNILQYPIALFGILRAGLIVVSVNPLYTARELEHQLKDSGAAAIVIFEGAAATLQSILRATPVKHVIVAAVGDMLGFVKGMLINFVLRRVKKMVPDWNIAAAVRFPEALAAGQGLSFTAPAVDTDDLAFLQYTGGTTGVSKGAMLKHRNVLADVAQVQVYFTGHVSEGTEVAVAPLPFYHILALVLNCMMHLALGSRQILVTIHLLRRREHALQRARPQRRVREARLQQGARVRRRRSALAAGGGETVEGDHRQAAGRGVRPHRDLRCGDGQSAQHQRAHRDDRISAAQYRSGNS